MTRNRNVRNTTKFKRSIKAISPVIATLLMIAIAVVASLVVYAWVTGYIGNTTGNAGKAIQIQSFASQGGNLVIYVQNVGQGDVELDKDQSVYVNSNLVSFDAQTQRIPLPVGQTVALQTNAPYTAGTKVNIKVTTTDGTFMTATGTGNSANPTTPAVTYAVNFVLGSPGGLSMNPTAGSHNVGGPTAISAQAITGYHFTSWTGTGSITFADANAASTTATVNGVGSITANFAADAVQYSVTFVLGSNGATITPTAGAHTYNAGDPVSISATANSGYHFTSWTSTTTSITFADANSASTTATIGAAGTVTANFAANTPVTITIRPDSAGSTTECGRSGSGGANWDRVDDVAADTTTYVYGDVDNSRQTDTYNIPDQSLTGTITNVRVYLRALETIDRTDVYAWTAIRISSGTIQYGTQIGTTTSWTNYYSDYATKSGNLGTGAWTWTDINNLQIGVGLESSFGSSDRYAECTQVWVEVTYVTA